MILFHSICLLIILCVLIEFIFWTHKNYFPKNMLFWVIVINGLVFSIQQIVYIIKYSIGG